MYTFAPLADIPVTHEGLFIVCLTCFAIFWMVVITEDFKTACATFVVLLMPIIGIAYGVSYHWTDQTPKTFKNEQVTGELVQYVAEGYTETVRSGKTTKQVDVHNTYVVYRVEGRVVMMQSKVGTSYPERVILYKN